MLNEETRAIIDIVGAWQFWTMYAIIFVLIATPFAMTVREFIKSYKSHEDQ